MLKLEQLYDDDFVTRERARIETSFSPLIESANSKIEETLDAYERKYPPIPEFPSTKTFHAIRNLLRGGKRFRFIVAYGAYSSVTKQPLRSIVPLLWPELFHPYTLFIDDVMDEDAKRRDFDSGWKSSAKLYPYEDRDDPAKIYKDKSTRWGVSNAILDGIIQFSLAQQLLNSIKDDYSQNLISKWVQKSNLHVSYGQKLDVDMEKVHADKTQYYSMSAYKTGALYVYSTETGAVIGHATPGQLANLIGFTYYFALNFQNQDDILGAGLVHNGDIGKPDDSDIRKGKFTLLKLYTVKNASSTALSKFNKLYGEENLTSGEVGEVRNIMKEYGLECVRKDMIENAKVAEDYLQKEQFHGNGLKILRDMLDYQFIRPK